MVRVRTFNDPGRQERNHQDGVQETARQGDEDCPREEFHEITHIGAIQQFQHGEKHERHGASGDEHRGHEAPSGDRRRIPTRVALIHQVRIAVNHHHGIVHNHTKHHNQGCQRHRIQFNTNQIHYRPSSSNTYRNRGRGHQCSTKWEEEKHHQNHDENSLH